LKGREVKATEAKLMSFLQKSPQFIIRIYQRTYSWTDKQCRQLWDDILNAGSSDGIAVHFIGSIVYVEQGLSQVSHQAPLLVIEGQQRLTTVLSKNALGGSPIRRSQCGPRPSSMQQRWPPISRRACPQTAATASKIIRTC
jgi:hypothetical protein